MIVKIIWKNGLQQILTGNKFGYEGRCIEIYDEDDEVIYIINSDEIKYIALSDDE